MGDWWKGVDVTVLGGKEKLHIDTLHDALENMVKTPERQPGKKMRTPLSGVYKIKGVGDLLTGRVEQGEVKPGDEVVFLPTHTADAVHWQSLYRGDAPQSRRGRWPRRQRRHEHQRLEQSQHAARR